MFEGAGFVAELLFDLSRCEFALTEGASSGDQRVRALLFAFAEKALETLFGRCFRAAFCGTVFEPVVGCGEGVAAETAELFDQSLRE